MAGRVAEAAAEGRDGRRPRWSLAVALAAAAMLVFAAGCGDEGGEQGPTPGVEETGSETTEEEGGATAADLPPGDAVAGAEVFAQNCSTCHGSTGAGAATGPSLQDAEIAEDHDAVAQQVIEGGDGMPPFGDTLSDQEIADVATFVVERVAGR